MPFWKPKQPSPESDTDYISKATEATARVRELLLEGRPASRTGSPQLLIVEDSQDDRAVYEVNFRKSDFVLTFAKSTEEAEQLIEPDKYELVLVDLALPGRDGTAVVRRIEAVAPRTPVAVASGSISGEHPSSILAISKPVTPQKILDAVIKLRAIMAAKVIAEAKVVAADKVTAEGLGETKAISER